MSLAADPLTLRRLVGRRAVLYGELTVVVLSLVGGVMSVAGDLSPTLWEAMGPQGRLSVPLPMLAAQLVLACMAVSARVPLALVGSGLLALAVLAGVVSGFFDGGYGDPRLTVPQHAVQVALVLSLAGVGVLCAARFVSAVRAGRPA